MLLLKSSVLNHKRFVIGSTSPVCVCVCVVGDRGGGGYTGMKAGGRWGDEGACGVGRVLGERGRVGAR